ncbi:type IV secretory system conjugative DNA transfer family protein [Flexivirga alba]|uniref:Type IV secretory system conjugative DNA transfer family protein n=1 Tax=Flexivirga alba TaxID=702742 RepID=A0ABW2AJ32_9MICO
MLDELSRIGATLTQTGPFVLGGLGLAGLALHGFLGRNAGTREQSRRHAQPSRREVRRAVGKSALMRRAATLRPAQAHATAPNLGYRLGTARNLDCWASVEDSLVVLGPPRSGKGLHVCIPAVLDAPGAVVTTSTRPDNLAATVRAREHRGPVAVFDPQHLAPATPSSTRWSPIRGCDDPHTAMVRAKALTVRSAAGIADASFWQAAAEQAVRCLLHAAALGNCTSEDLYRWSLSAVHAREAVMILSSRPAAARSWHQALDSIVSAEPRQRDSIWAMVTIAFNALADPAVLDAVSPAPGEQFEPEQFLRANGTLYLLGTSSGSSATANLVAALVEDVVETARRLAAHQLGGRLEPPLTVVLDEAANYPLPSLPSLMSDGGGCGIGTLVVLQSLAQARHVWGEHAASAIWDAASMKIILGGGSNARDLDDLSKLLGQRDERSVSTSRGPGGRRSTSTTRTRVPILEPAALRTLPFGTAILLARSAPPMRLTLSPWTKRKQVRALTQTTAVAGPSAARSGGFRT